MGYSYASEHWCDSCGESIQRDLDAKGIEDTGDSNDYPQYFDGSIQETDAPCHCASNEECLEAEHLGTNWNQSSGESTEHKIGAIVCERLTSEGVDYVKTVLKEKESSVAYFWKNFFDIEVMEDDALICD